MADLTIIKGARAAPAFAGLSTLASAASALSAIVNPAGYAYARCDLSLTWAVAPAADLPTELWIVQQADGATFEDGTANTTPVLPQWLAHSFTTRAATTVYRVSPIIPIPPDDFKFLIVNKTLQAYIAAAFNWTPMTERWV
jgi:hypothetical protein